MFLDETCSHVLKSLEFEIVLISPSRHPFSTSACTWYEGELARNPATCAADIINEMGGAGVRDYIAYISAHELLVTSV